MAYNALVSLVQILNKLLRSDQLSIPYPKLQIESLHEKACFLQSFIKEKSLEPNNSTSFVHDLETQIIDAICEAEDIIESHMSTHLLPPELYENSSGDEIFPHKLLQVLQQFDSTNDAASKILNDTDHRGKDRRSRSLAPFLLSRYLGRNYEKLVEREDIITKIVDQLTNQSYWQQVIGVVGMVGIGKTALVNKVYNHPHVRSYFDYQAWASVGSRSNLREILQSLLLREYHDQELSDRDLGHHLNRKLMENRYLIVLDDIRDVDTWDELRSIFPEDDFNGSRIVITTRLRKIVIDAASTENIHQVSFLDENKVGIYFPTQQLAKIHVLLNL